MDCANQALHQLKLTEYDLSFYKSYKHSLTKKYMN